MGLFSLSAWTSTSRPKTLFLSIACILAGNASVFRLGKFNPAVFFLTLLTAVLLQIISNFCNDLGDVSKGTDEGRLGTKRAVHLGLITVRELQIMTVCIILLSVASGLCLLYVALWSHSRWMFAVFVGFGGLSILAAAKYTLGKIPYGYIGLGDIAVFIFFGLLAVTGSNYLQTLVWDAAVLLPAAAFGLWSVGVMNLNNLRDVTNDRQSGKKTPVVLMGADMALIYHFLLTFLPAVLLTVFLGISEQTLVIHLLQILAALLFLPGFIQLIRLSKKTAFNRLLGSYSRTVLIQGVVFFGCQAFQS